MARMDENKSYFDLWNELYGSVIFHWGMLLTMYCLHNISYGLPVGCLEGDLEEDKPPKFSMEWFLCKIGFGPENDPTSYKNQKQKQQEQQKSMEDGNRDHDVRSTTSSSIVGGGGGGSSKKSVSFVDDMENGEVNV
jgi:hypothetical protein